MRSLGSASARLEVLGRFRLATSTGVLTSDELSSAQVRTVVAVLVLDGAPTLSAEGLADALWGAERPSSWRALVRGLVLQVREAIPPLGDARLDTTPEGYDLRVPGGVTTDLGEVTDLVRTAEQALERGRTTAARRDAGAATDALRTVLLPGAEGPWVARRRTAVTGLHTRALVVAAQVHLARGELTAAAEAATTATSLDPTSERACRVAIQAHIELGEAGAAAAAYRRCRDALAEQHGVLPSESTRALADDLIDLA